MTRNSGENTDFRNADGTFAKGNPGKPKGSRNRATQAVQGLIEDQCEAITQKAVEMALEGDTTAIRLCIERIAPARKDAPVEFDMPPVDSAQDAAQAASAILSEVASGSIIPRQHSTGGRTVLGRISKRGSRYLRMLFVQAANVVLMRPHHWPGFSFGDCLPTKSPAIVSRSANPKLSDFPGPRRFFQSAEARIVDLSFAGRQGKNHPALCAIAEAKTGDALKLVHEQGRWIMQDEKGRCLGRLAKSFSPPPNSKFLRGEIAAILRWRKEDGDEAFHHTLRRDAWEVVVPELVFEAL